jgi:hypothetical protein
MVNLMTDRSLSSLYRRLGARAQAGSGELLDAETLVAAAAGSLRGDRRDEVAMRLAHSEAQTDLVRLLRELVPAADALVSAVQDRDGAAHAPRGRGHRHAANVRRHAGLRWAGLAACLVVAFGAIGIFQHRERAEEAAMAAAMEAASRPDRIFTSVDRIFAPREDAPSAPASDALFHANFNGG